MDSLPGRKRLPHEAPSHLPGNVEGEVFFITICASPRGMNQLAHPNIWEAVVETVLHREASGDLKARLLLAMPDHLHGLFMFEGSKPMRKVIAGMKAWLARAHGINWQRDFFDHRLRSWESAHAKGAYIRANPLRGGLIKEGQQWPFCLDRIGDR